NPDRALLPGMFVHARLVAGVKSEAILAPQQGVTRDARGQPIAMVLDADNKVQARTLRADRTVGSNWLIGEGLAAGDRLITEGLQFIQPGQQVEPVPATNVSAAASTPDGASQ